MPDQDIFDSFDAAHVSVHPLPAADVRRRGDRMRRRRTAALVGVTAAAVAVITAGGVALGPAGGGRTAPPPVAPPEPTPSVTEPPATSAIPEDFPIDTEDSTPEVPPDDYLAQQLGYCGVTPLADVSPVDAMSAQVAGGETNTAVTLLLFDNKTEAARALDNLVDSAAGCPREVTNVVGEVEVLPEADPWPGQSIRTAYPADARYVHGVQAGPALLLSSWYVAGTPAEQGLVESRAAIAEQLAALDETWDVPGWSASGQPGDTGADPAGLQLDWRLGEDGDTVDGPGARAQGVAEISPCGREAWPVSGTDRLAVTATGTGVSESRELVTLGSADEAVAAMDRVRAALAACDTEVNQQDPTANGEQVWTTHSADTGHDSVTFSRLYTDGLPGGTFWQLTRVDDTILAVGTDGEYTQDSATYVVKRLTRVTAHLTSQL